MARLLLIDDDPALLSLLRRTLERAGYEVVTAPNGREGLQRLTTGPFDLLITDIVMPEMEGLELILKLRQTHPALRIIAISGGGQLRPASYLNLARLSGAMTVLAKPFELEELLTAVQKLLTSEPPSGTSPRALG
jgi:CheY-like chemotaxis protein